MSKKRIFEQKFTAATSWFLVF